MSHTHFPLSVPDPNRTLEIITHDGATIRVRQHGRVGAPRLVLSHGNGLAIDAYLPFWGPLCERYEVVIFDFRNHGQNPLHTLEGHSWHNFIVDMELVLQTIQREFGSAPTAGVFHSLSAVTAALHSLRYGDRWRLLVLIDPPFYPRDGHPLRISQHFDKNSLAERALRRMERYDSPDVLAGQFRTRPAFRRWVAGAAELMARATLRRDERNGGWTLACPREYEAKIFSSNADPELWSRLGQLKAPVKLVCGDPTIDDVMPPALIGRAIAEEHSIEYEAIPDTTHFLQIERPDACIRAVESFLVGHGMRE
ncbi:MAG: alpha/beta fold hydrolase [Candidatus Binataceae bacterium]